MIETSAAAFNDYNNSMSLLRKVEISLMSYLFKNRTLRLAKKRADFLKKISLSALIVIFWQQTEFKVSTMLRENE
jgi:hypothetical protein